MKRIFILLTALASLTIASTVEAQLFISVPSFTTFPPITTVTELNLVTGTTTSLFQQVSSPNLPGSFGNTLYVAATRSIASYNASTGQVINPSFITGLLIPLRVIVSGNNLFVSDVGLGTVGEYDATTGAPINTTFATFPVQQQRQGSSWPIAISGNTRQYSLFTHLFKSQYHISGSTGGH